MTLGDNQPHDADDKFGDFVKREARGFNVPAGPVPRDEMWQAIATVRADARRAAVLRRRYLGVGVAMAAMLVIGVALGRYGRGGAAPEVALAPADSGTASYRVATAAHLVGVEAMLTSFASASPGARTDSAVARWARDLLFNTRLLLDSPAAADAPRRRLLEDLERVLVQIVQASPAESNAEMRAHVERSIGRTHMIMRLRALQDAALNGGSEE